MDVHTIMGGGEATHASEPGRVAFVCGTHSHGNSECLRRELKVWHALRHVAAAAPRVATACACASSADEKEKAPTKAAVHKEKAFSASGVISV